MVQGRTICAQQVLHVPSDRDVILDSLISQCPLQNFKTVLKDHEGSGDFIDVRTLVLVLRHKDLPHGQFRAESKGSNISYPDRRVSTLRSLI